MNRTVSILFSGTLLVSFVLYTRAFPRSPVVWVGAATIILIYLAMIWAPQHWWTRTRYIASVCLVLAIAVALAPIHGKNAADPYLLFPLVLLLAKEQRHYRRIATILAALTLVVFFLFALPSAGAFIWGGGVIALYFSVRGINIYKVAHSLSESRLQALDQAHQELQKVHAELQEARLHSMRYAALVERTRLAQEVHDGLGHQLTSLIIQLQALEIMLPGDPERAAAAVPSMLDAARKAMAEVRLAVREWRDDESGLGLVAVQGLVWQTAARSQLTIDFEQHGPISDWSTELSVAIYRIVQEALTNIMRHAGATAAAVRVEEHDGLVILTISDNGHYTPDTPLLPGFGLQGIRERARAFGGSYTLSPNQPHGLTLQVTFSLDTPTGSGITSPETFPEIRTVLPAISL